MDKNVAAIHEIKPILTLNKPIHVGFTDLELSNWLMYDFHYYFIKRKFDLNLSFTDTDSLIYEIKSKDVYEEFFKYRHLFDISKHQSIFFDPTYKRVIGQTKDELKGISINKFIGLKSKMHCIVSDDDTGVSTAKGVNIFNEHEDVLFNEILIRHKMKKTQSKVHKIGTYNVCKLSLSCFDDKRWTLNNGIKTLAYFPKDLKG